MSQLDSTSHISILLLLDPLNRPSGSGHDGLVDGCKVRKGRKTRGLKRESMQLSAGREMWGTAAMQAGRQDVGKKTGGASSGASGEGIEWRQS